MKVFSKVSNTYLLRAREVGQAPCANWDNPFHDLAKVSCNKIDVKSVDLSRVSVPLHW